MGEGVSECAGVGVSPIKKLVSPKSSPGRDVRFLGKERWYAPQKEDLCFPIFFSRQALATSLQHILGFQEGHHVLRQTHLCGHVWFEF